MRAFFASLIVIVTVVACDSGGPGTTSPAAPLDEKAVQAVEERQAVLKLMKRNFVPLVGMAREKLPYDAALAQKSATHISHLVVMLEDVFAADTRGSGVETEALDNIWTEMDQFKEKAVAAERAANNLALVAGDQSQFNDAVMAVRDACGSCHDDFRVEQE